MVDFDRVTLANVSRHFGRRRALSQVSLTARGGEIIGLLGPNGAGKSTLIGVLSTLVTATSGEVLYGDRTGSRSIDVRSRIGLLAHELFLYPELTARQNLSFFARLHGVPDDASAVTAALDRAGLSDRADDDIARFSRGMKQRLAFERALLHGPRLILLDEPFTGLDDAAGAVVTARLRRLAGEGAIIFLATHDLDLADGLVTRVVLVQRGRLIADEPAPAGLRAHYRSRIDHA